MQTAGYTQEEEGKLDFSWKHLKKRADETKISFYQNEGKQKTANDSKRVTFSAKHGGDNVVLWEWMAPTGTGYLVFTDDVIADISCRMNSEVVRTILSI